MTSTYWSSKKSAVGGKSTVTVTTTSTIPSEDPNFSDGFEDGSTTDTWFVNDFTADQTRTYNGSYSAYCSTAISDAYQGRKNIVPCQPSSFEFFWNETSGSFGGGIRLINSSGDVELGLATDNPEWDIDDANGVTQVYNAGDYDDWTRFTVNFDWVNGTFSVDFEDTADGDTYTDSGRPLKQGVDIAAIQVDDYNNGTWQDGGSIDMWFDDISISGASTQTGDVTLTLYEDVGSDGSGSSTDTIGNSYDNSASVSLSGGTDETNDLSGFDGGGSTNDYWTKIEVSGPGGDPTFATPTITKIDAAVESAVKTAAATIASTSSDGVNPTILPGAVSTIPNIASTTSSTVDATLLTEIGGTMTVDGSSVSGIKVFIVSTDETNITATFEATTLTDSSGNWSYMAPAGQTYHISAQYDDGSNKYAGPSNPHITN